MKKILLSLILLACSTVFAKETVKIVIPYSVGGTSDRIGRILATYLSSDEYQFVATNIAGAGGATGALHVATEKEPLLMLAGQSVLINGLSNDSKYNLDTDFVLQTCVTTEPMVILVKNTGAINSFQDIRNLAKTKNVPYGTSGIGSVQSMVSEIIINKQPNFTEIPYKGSGELLNSLMSDVIVWYMDNRNLSSGLVDAGKVKILASSAKLKKNPEVPTFSEIGINVNGFTWRQLFISNNHIGPALQSYLDKKLSDPALAEHLQSLGYDSCINVRPRNGMKSEKEIVKRIIK